MYVAQEMQRDDLSSSPSTQVQTLKTHLKYDYQAQADVQVRSSRVAHVQVLAIIT
jgi:hypothetical protein